MTGAVLQPVCLNTTQHNVVHRVAESHHVSQVSDNVTDR